MKHSTYIIGVVIVGLLSWTAWIIALVKFDPYESTTLALPFFFVSLALALAATFTLIGYYLRKWLKRNEIYYSHINISLRQGILLSLAVVISLIFLFLGILTWWVGLLLVMIITLIEFYFVSTAAA